MVRKIKYMKLKQLLFFLKERVAYAHCDIPCGIYDPHASQVAAHTILRMTQLISEIKIENETKAEHDIARMTLVKEEHSDLLEEELDTLAHDYFKPEQYEQFPDLRELFEKALKSGAKARQNIDIEAAKETLGNTMQIAEIFFKSKGVDSIRVPSLFPTGGEIVVQK